MTTTTARPGVVITGKKGAEIDALRKKLGRSPTAGLHRRGRVKRPSWTPSSSPSPWPSSLEGRVAFRRAMRKAVQSAMVRRQGHPHQCRPSGRAEMSRREWYREGRAATPSARRSTTASPRRHHHGLHRRAGVGVPRRGAAGPEGSPARAEGSSRPNRSRRNDRREVTSKCSVP